MRLRTLHASLATHSRKSACSCWRKFANEAFRNQLMLSQISPAHVSAIRSPTTDASRGGATSIFYLPHRSEARGVGGIFFDYLTERLSEVFAFVRDAGDHFLDAYVPIVERRLHEPYGDRERRWQLARRGRYVEFNLLYDRGTMFGLKTSGRVESILMSLPPQVVWGYNEIPPPGSLEAELFAYLRPRDWASEEA
jgi:coproporphyrinogen III oxidase